MPLKSREKDHERDRDRNRSSTVKSRDKDKDSKKDTDKEKKRHSRSSHGKSSELSTKERSRGGTVGRSATSSTTTSTSSRRRRRSSMADVESAGRSGAASFLESRTSLPYPSFSKAHSKEVVGSRERVDHGFSILTPDPTDVDSTKDKSGSPGKDAPNGTTTRSDNHNAPPSPPLTSMDQRSQRKDSSAGNRSSDEKTSERARAEKAKVKIKSQSSSSLSARKDDKSKSSKSYGEVDSPHRTTSHKTPSSRMHDEVKLPRRSASHATSSPSRSSPRPAEAASQATNDSEATSVAPNQPSAYQRPTASHTRPPSRGQTRSSMSHRSDIRKQTPIEVFVERDVSPTSAGYGAPPPPPPPPEMPISIPRVDYLLQNGGLHHKVPKNLLAAGESSMTQQSFQPQVAVGKVFEPYNRLLDDYAHIMAKNGSLAVATGYRSVARRLLDRLEAVFARDISSESCECLICENRAPDEHVSGVSWGEVLELVSGRRELPNWPPFTIAPSLDDNNVSGEEHIPMQKLDIDVPEEYRDHYIRQSRKTKLAVDKWLTEQSTSAPDEVDDETLTFAIMTHLEPEKRALFRALLGHSTSVPTSPAEPRARPAVLRSSGLAIQRLYRLMSVPRDPEIAIYMLDNLNMHNVLATLAAISDDEWDILVSGRFDGFLRSGAEDAFIPSMSGSVPSRPLSQSTSRSTTPFNGSSRGPTPSYMDGSYRPASQPYGTNGVPASFGAPIAMDEETEIAALAEVERDIYLSMEALEDAFEALHCKAEAVRHALRERGAGLAVASQARRGSYVEARLGTPASALHAWEEGPEDDGIDDDMSLAPDDSASNVSSNRRRRPKRRTERRTPAPVEEEDEEEDAHISRRDTKGSRRR
ncbi:hypothetical protein Plec18167_007063 [Paecilomyces lecythidis]|uniref:5-Methylcytosine G/T mismatch-specific DNA glycosylase n=1 Tax=Paecilomyces lecythidis TaxID=3004212 RepID=A0ABR3X6G6_9EURO